MADVAEKQLMYEVHAMSSRFHRFLFVYIYVFSVLPESARWLMAKNKFEETEKVLQKIAKGNKTADKLPNDLVDQLTKQEEVRCITITQFS